MASEKLTSLTAIGAPALEDLLYVVDDPSGSPIHRKMTLAQLKALISGPKSISVLTTGSGATYTVPAGTYAIRVKLVGAGGGGGGSDGTTAGVSAGGSAGGYCEKLYAVTPGQTFTYTVSNTGGAGGAAGNNAGTQGADTTFDNAGSILTGGGGPGGGSMATGSSVTAAVTGGVSTATGGTINIPGGSSCNALRTGTAAFSLSMGANSMLGQGGSSGVNSTGGAGIGYGAGGGGTVSTSGQADQAGGAGAPGVIFVEEF